MMKLVEFIKKNLIIIIILFSILIIGFVGIFIYNRKSMKEYENNNYSLKYDNSWTLISKKNSKLVLKHGRDARVNIEVLELNDEVKYSSIDELIDEVIYSIEKQNAKFNLISKTKDDISKYNYKGYKLLYENGNSQVMITTYKKSDKLIMFNYEASNDCFDILLDSVHNIMYNFDIKEERYEITSGVKIKDVQEVTYSKNKKLDKKISKNQSIEIASHNYYVKYTIPDIFTPISINSNYNYYEYKDGDDYIKISTSIYSSSVFEFFDDNSSMNIFKYNGSCDEKECKDFSESFSIIDKNVETYLYKNHKNNFIIKLQNKEIWKECETAILLFSLNKNTTMTITIESKVPISEKLINSIDIKEIKNYSSYIVVKEDGDNQLFTLKDFEDYNKEKVVSVDVVLPKKYKGYERFEDNIYNNRYFGLNYDEDRDLYDYDIFYSYSNNNSSIDSLIKYEDNFITEAYGSYSKLEYDGDITLNNKTFKVYKGYRTDVGGVLFAVDKVFKYRRECNVLFYELDNGTFVVISVYGNDNTISDDILNDVTNFDVKITDV